MKPIAPVLCACAALLAAAGVHGQQAPADPRRPTFRSGAHYVRVDVYPTRDGKPIPGLTADDFQLFEDGALQTIDSIEYIDHPAWTPDLERRDPNSQRDAFALARNPNYRVFVLYLDAYHLDFGAGHRLRIPIRDLLNRMMGPRDLFGVLTPAQRPRVDLMLGQQTLSIEEQLTNNWFWEERGKDLTPEELELAAAYMKDGHGAYLIALRRLDKVYSDLEELIDLFGELREERKNIIFFSDSFPSPRSRFNTIASDPYGRGTPPPIGVGNTGTLTMGSRDGVERDRLRTESERARLLAIDFDSRFRAILRRARQANVSFYTVRPGGLDMNSSLLREGTSNLRVLSDETDGVAVLASNDLRAGLNRIADDLSSHYVLGYYTNNTRWDRNTRKITVELKATGQALRARREYRAPTQAEMDAIRSGPAAAPSAPTVVDHALAALKRLRPATRFQAYGTAGGDTVSIVAEIAGTEAEIGRWKTGGSVDVTLTARDGTATTASARIEPGARGTIVRVPVGDHPGPWQAVVKARGDDPLPESDTLSIARDTGRVLGTPVAYRAASAAASAFRPLAAFHFRRTERLRLDFPVPQAPDTHNARLLDRTGKPLPVPVPLTLRTEDGRQILSATLNLAPLSIGDYLIEVNATAGGVEEQQVIAIRVAMAR